MSLVDALRSFRRRWPKHRAVTQAIAPAPSGALPSQNLPRTRSEIALAAAALNLTIPDACIPGVVANLALLDGHADILLDRVPQS